MATHAEVLGFDVVRVGDHAAPDVGGRPRDRGQRGAEQSAGARFRDRDGQARLDAAHARAPRHRGKRLQHRETVVIVLARARGVHRLNGQGRAGPRRSAGRPASPVVGELERHVDVEVAELLDHRLKLVLVLARDPQLIPLGPDLRLRMLATDPLGQVPCQLLADALAELDDLPDVSLRRQPPASADRAP